MRYLTCIFYFLCTLALACITCIMQVRATSTEYIHYTGDTSVEETVYSHEGDAWAYIESILPENEIFAAVYRLLKHSFTAYDEDSGIPYKWRYSNSACIWMDGEYALCPKYTYTALEQKQLELLIRETFTEHASVWSRIFGESPYRFRLSRSAFFRQEIDTIIDRIPRGHVPSRYMYTHDENMAQMLLDASFYLDQSIESENTLLQTLERQVMSIAEDRCMAILYDDACFDNNVHLLQYFIPGEEEILDAEIFRDGQRVRIGSLEDEILFRIVPSQSRVQESHEEVTLTPENIGSYYTPGAALFFYKKTHYTYQEALDFIETRLGEKGIVPLGSRTKNYTPLIEGQTIPELPAILSVIPHDRLVLYIRDPHAVYKWMTESESALQIWLGENSLYTIRRFIDTAFRFDVLRSVLASQKGEMVVILDNTDIKNGTIVYVLSEPLSESVIAEGYDLHQVTHGQYTWVSSHPDILTQYIQSSSQSLAAASDFLYVWARQGSNIQGAFLYAGDAFFARLTSFSDAISRYRSEAAHAYLWQIQHAVWAYQLLHDEGVTMDLIRPYLAGIPENFLDSLTLEDDGIVVHSYWGSLKKFHSLYAIGEGEISRHEIDRYLSEVFDYEEIWSHVLDPMGVVINPDQYNFWMQFFMTPVPNISDDDFDALRWWIEDTAPESLHILRNPKIRSGIFTAELAFDFIKLRQKEGDNSYDYHSIARFVDDVIGTGALGNRLNGEFAITLGSLDAKVLEHGWDPASLDIFFTIGFTSEDMARSSVDMARRHMTSLFSEGRSLGPLQKLFSQPAVEEYTHGTIYYVESFGMPFFGNISIAYTYVDKYLILAFNRDTIRRVLDTAHSGDRLKSLLGDDPALFSSNFGILINRFAFLESIRSWDESQLQSLMTMIRDYDETPGSWLNAIFAPAWTNYVYSKYLDWDYNDKYTLPGIDIHFQENDILLKVDHSAQEGLHQNLSDKYIPLFSEDGITLSELLENPDIIPFFETWVMSQFRNVLHQEGVHQFVPNMLFTTQFYNDSIGFTLSLIDDRNDATQSGFSYRWMILFFIVSISAGIIILVMIFLILRDREKNKKRV